MSDSEPISRKRQLRTGNYAKWAMRMEALLIQKELWDVVEPPEEKEAVGKKEEGVETATIDLRPKRQMDQARSLLIEYAKKSQLSYMRDKDPRKIWIQLEKVHRLRGLATEMSLKRKLINSQKNPAQPMHDWIGTISGIRWELEKLGNTIDDKDIILALTTGLGSDYETFVQTLDSTPRDELTLDFVIKRLINEESQRGDQPTESGSGESRTN